MPAPTAEAPKTAPQIPPVVPAPVAPAPAPKTNVRERLGIKKAAAKSEAEPAAAAPAPVVPAKPAVASKPKPKTATPSTVVIDEEKLGKAIAKNLPNAQPAAPITAAPEKKEPELSPVNARRLQVLNQMAADNPMLKTLPEEFMTAIKNEKEYRAKWESENKGKTFNPEDTEHEDFFSGNDVTWDADEYDLAKDNIQKAEAKAAAEGVLKPKMDALDEKERANAAIPQIITHQATTAKLLFDDLGTDFAKVLKPNGDIDIAEVTRLKEENPIYAKVFPIAEHAERIAGEIYRIAKGLSKYNSTLPIHREIADFVFGQEAALKAAPAENQKNSEGKTFATAEEWSKMDDQQRKDHWTFSENELSAIFAAQSAAKAKKIIEAEENNFKTLAEKRGFKAAGSEKSPPAANGQQPKPAEIIPPAPASPAGINAPRMASPQNHQPSKETSVFKRLRGYK
jgi:hypothetical protein